MSFTKKLFIYIYNVGQTLSTIFTSIYIYNVGQTLSTIFTSIYIYNVGQTLSTIFTSNYSSKNISMSEVIAHVFPQKMSVNCISTITHITVITSIK